MIAFIVNSKAGGGKVKRVWPGIEAQIQKMWGSSYAVRYPQSKAQTIECAREELRNGAEMVVAVGGDGTLHDVVNGFFADQQPINPRAALAVLALGTGADFIRSLAWPTQISEALARLRQPEIKTLDLGQASFIGLSGQPESQYFINILDFGMGGAVVDRVNHTTKFFGGKISFLWAIVTTLFTYQNKPVQFQIDGSLPQTQRINNFIIGNGKFFGGGLMPVPQAKLDDGYLDAVILGDLGLLEALRNLPKLRQGTHLDHPKLKCYPARRVEAQSAEPVWIDMDGELVGQLPIAIQVIPHALPFVV